MRQQTKQYEVYNAGELPNYGVLVLASPDGKWALSFDYEKFGLGHLIKDGDHPAHVELCEAFQKIADVLNQGGLKVTHTYEWAIQLNADVEETKDFVLELNIDAMGNVTLLRAIEVESRMVLGDSSVLDEIFYQFNFWREADASSFTEQDTATGNVAKPVVQEVKR